MTEDTRASINRYLNLLLVVLAFSLPLYRPWVSTAAPLVTILWLVEGRLAAKLAVLRRHWLSLAAVAFIAFNLLSLIWSTNPAEGLEYVAKYRYLLLIPVIATSLRRQLRATVETWFVIGSVLSVVVSFTVAAGLVRVRDAFEGNPSPFMSHLDYSMVLAVAAVIVLLRVLEGPRSSRLWPVRIAALAVLTAGLMLNIGRSGQAAFVAATLVAIPLVLWRRSPGRALVATAAAVAVLAAAYAAVVPLRQRVDAGINELTGALTAQRYDTNQGKRIAGARVAADMIRERPVLGTGVGANIDRFRELLNGRHRELRAAVGWFPHLHNQYLQVATELGLVGLVLLLGMIAALAAGPYPDRYDRHLAVVVSVTYLVGFLGDPYLHKQLPLVLFATVAGLVSARGRSVFWEVTRDV
jgi:O-antigen ligase